MCVHFSELTEHRFGEYRNPIGPNQFKQYCFACIEEVISFQNKSLYYYVLTVTRLELTIFPMFCSTK